MKLIPLTKERLNHLAEIGEVSFDYAEPTETRRHFVFVGESTREFEKGESYKINITGFNDNGDPIACYVDDFGLVRWLEINPADWKEITEEE